MLVHGPYFAKYGTQTTFYVSLEDVSITDAPFIGVAPLAADIFLSKDGGATAAATNAMTAIGNGIYSWVATATELSCSRLIVSVYDQTASEIFKPIFFKIITRLALGTFDIDATQIGGNTDGLTVTGIGTGVGFKLAGASAAAYTNLFSQLEGTEPSGMIADNATILAILQFIKRRFGNKRTQTSTTFTQFKDDSSTSCWTATVADDGTTQTVGKGA